MIFGTPGDDVLTGTAGWDTIYAGEGDDTVTGLAGGDVLSGQGGDDLLKGGAGDDYLMGGAGSDRILGGAGAHDWASYEDASGPVLVNLARTSWQDTNSGGQDLLKGVENLYGSAFDDALLGSNKDNTLSGGGGSDLLQGGLGDDVLNGGDGADTMDGGRGRDQAFGGAGDDVYSVDTHHDVIVEEAGAGHDRVISSVSYHLTANVEDLILSGPASSSGWGNELDNYIQGNDVQSLLYGGAGNDNLQGMGGDDLLAGGSGSNTLGGGDGSDTVSYADSHVSVYVHLGLDGYQSSSHSQDILISVENAIGGSASDIFWASSDHNVLTGGGGADLFVFSSLGGFDGDRITDIGSDDHIDLHNIDSDATQWGVQHGFHLVADFTGHTGEVVVAYAPSLHSTVVLLDVTGDGASDATLVLNGDVSDFHNFAF